ncbi:MAG: radical SAM protein [Candidatus Methylarchaceae archaeon HK01B]|nr:radical SAM protein [Candidatus Methylarchaceae archaeon HK01B]
MKKISKSPKLLLARSSAVHYLLKRLTDNCPECGGFVLEKLIRKVEEGDEPVFCAKCKFLFYFARGCYSLLKAKGVGVDKSALMPVPLSKKGYSLPSYIRGARAILRGIATFGLKEPIIPSVPLTVILEFTRVCNLRCPYCYVDTYDSQKSEENLGLDELSTEEWIDCIDSLNEAGVAGIVFSGGEPLLRKDFFKVAEYASSKGLIVSLATNGTMLDKRTVKKLRNIGVDYIEISLFSAKSDLNDAFRGKGSFEKSVNAAKYCMEEGRTVGLAITIVKQTKDEIEEFLKLAKNIGVDIAIFLNFIPVGNAFVNKNLDLDPYEKEEVLKLIVEKRQVYDNFFRKIVVLQSTQIARVCYEMAEDNEGFELKQIGFTKFAELGKYKFLNYVGGCSAGRFLATIAPNGNILPCPFLRLKLGDVRKDDFVDIWTSNPILNKLRDRKNWKGRCGKCGYKIVCGGCRARAYAYLNDFLESDPICILNAKPSDISC